MIRVRVELLSAVDPRRSRELARMDICNEGNETTWNPRFGSYLGTTYRGRDREALDLQTPAKVAGVAHWPRDALHVWNLVATMLEAMGYIRGTPTTKLVRAGDEVLDEVLSALEDSEERASKLAAELEIYRLVYGELAA